MKRLKFILSLVLICVCSAFAHDVKVTATIDSVETVQGKLRKIDVTVLQSPDVTLEWSVKEQQDKNVIQELFPSIEIRNISSIDTMLSGDKMELRRSLLIQPWDSGEYVIPGLFLTANLDTFRSNSIVLKVLPAYTDTMTTIDTKAYMPVVDQERHFFDWVPDWLYYNWWIFVICIALIVGGILAYLIFSKKLITRMRMPLVKVIPPYEKAIGRLNELRERNLCEKGQEKQYYTILTEILREYLEGRFGIYAMEMTTPQIKRAVYAAVPAKTASKLMSEILEMADYVKFARMRPLPEDNMRAYNQAVTFVEDTKPEPQIQEKEVKK
ncbi:MAG: hypothetical protein E7082_05600 [Bacteroidales bacterium]|nr:hypothetical protein [Bacteroidales bacterium]